MSHEIMRKLKILDIVKVSYTDGPNELVLVLGKEKHKPSFKGDWCFKGVNNEGEERDLVDSQIVEVVGHMDLNDYIGVNAGTVIMG